MQCLCPLVDGFVRSWIKQEENNVWILTMIFPDADGSATLPFHIFCLAVGMSNKDHQHVLDHYMNEAKH